MDMIDRLAGLPALAEIPRDQLQWLVDHGEVHEAEDGATYRVATGGLFLVISGRFSVRVEQGGVEREVREVTPGRITGFLPYSRMTKPRGYLVADGPIEFLSVGLEDLREMTRACYDFTAVCVHEMLERVRDFKSEDKRQEKMAALGRLSAGLAHELNNPASAAAQAARALDAARAEVVAAARELGAAGLEGDASRALRSLESAARERAGSATSPMEMAEREDGIAAWLDERQGDAELAYPLARSGLTAADLDAAAASLDAAPLAVVLRYLAADGTVRGLTADITSAAGRIHALVAAMKAHTHMDRGPAAERIRLEEHLADAVALMRAKAALKGVTVELEAEAGLPEIEGSVAELNQVWIHLVDNAIEAAAGRVTIDARMDLDNVAVRIIDDGPGIPAELQERVFDPFYTTRRVGEGRGLGLDVVRTVVESHRGTVDLTSRPGRTELRVTLPACGVRSTAG